MPESPASETPVTHRLPAPGDEFAGYRLLGVLGRGRTSVVYEAENPRLQNVIALKVLTPELAGSEVFRSRFFDESRIAASLNHPNVIPIHDMGEGDGLLYIAMRRVAGTDLRQLLNSAGRLPASRSLHLLTQVARALDAAHRQGLVHRDVKPGNLLVEPGGDDPDHMYLTDFGITKVISSRTGLTSPGEFVGTVDYIAPEQIRGISVMGMADQYSLACVLYECLTGHVPFRKDVEAAVIFAHVEEPPPAPSDVCPDVPRAADDVLARALAKRPGDRYPSCREFIEAAGRALKGEVPQPASEVAHRGTTGVGAFAGTPEDLASIKAVWREPRRPRGDSPPPPDAQHVKGVRDEKEETEREPASPPAARGRGKRRWAAAAAALVLIGAGAGTLYILRPGSGPQSGGPVMQPAAASMRSGMASSAPARSPLMTAIVQANTITKDLPTSTCTQHGTTQVTCVSPSPGIAEAMFRTYPSLTALYSAYEQAMKSLDGGHVLQNVPACGLQAPPVGGAELAWNHQFKNPAIYSIASMVAGKVPQQDAAGRYFCITSPGTGAATILWTQDDGHVLGVVSGPLHEQIWDWWKLVHHEIAIGKPAMSMPSMPAG
jgi:serine/threonine-protein kinase